MVPSTPEQVRFLLGRGAKGGWWPITPAKRGRTLGWRGRGTRLRERRVGVSTGVQWARRKGRGAPVGVETFTVVWLVRLVAELRLRTQAHEPWAQGPFHCPWMRLPSPRHRAPRARRGRDWPGLQRERSGPAAMLPPGNRSRLGPPSRSAHAARSVPCPTCLAQAPDAPRAAYPGGAWEDSRDKAGQVSGCLGFRLGRWLPSTPKSGGEARGATAEGLRATVSGGSGSPAASLLTLAWVTVGPSPQGRPALDLTAPSLCCLSHRALPGPWRWHPGTGRLLPPSGHASRVQWHLWGCYLP